MHVVGIQGLSGGSGATTVCAGLSVAMNNFGTRSIALDLQLDNCLGAHFGMQLEVTDGLLPQAAAARATNHAATTGKGIEDCVFESDQGYPFIPFGRVPATQEERALNTLNEKLPGMLAPLLQLKDRILFVDVPRTAGPLRQWVYQHADVIINVLQPEPRLASALLRFSTHTLPQQSEYQAHSKVLINQMAPNLAIARDSSDYLHGVLHSSMLLPVAVHRDQHAVEAFAALQPVHHYHRSAQVSRDFDALALWLAGYLADLPARKANIADSAQAATSKAATQAPAPTNKGANE
ncbi:MAG: hypothetical protein LAT53_04610 [Idiomarina sp.]|nr:hypothetical protein [Idiomarina sp.]